MRADRELILLLLRNLARNACVYCAADTVKIWVMAQTRDGQQVVSFRDNGVGIRAEDQARIFRPFFRAAATQERRGSGLGLTICDQIARAHGASIRIAESRLGDGTTFELRLPGDAP